MNTMTLLAQESGYWFAGVLTAAAALAVTVVILVSSRSKDHKARRDDGHTR